MVSVAQLGPPVDVRPQFAAARASLLDLLRALDPAQWTVRTVCPGWEVRDLAAHLLHDDLRRLSRTRDHYSGAPEAAAEARAGDLVQSLNAANQRWVSQTAFLSPALLVDLLEHTGRLIETLWATADLDAPSEAVWWAGVSLAPVWLDLARDYSEEWIHQQQIRDAAHRPGLTEATSLDPVLDILLRALPHTYRHLPPPMGASVLIVLTAAERELTWTLSADPDGWTLHNGRPHSQRPTTTITTTADRFWRLAAGALSADAARTKTSLAGDRELGEPFLHIVSVVR